MKMILAIAQSLALRASVAAVCEAAFSDAVAVLRIYPDFYLLAE
jgi:hypothetical protein